MATFSSKAFTISQPINKIYGLVSNPENLSSVSDKLEKVFSGAEAFTATPDSLSFKVASVGNLKFTIIERNEPNLVKFEGEGTPLPINVLVNLLEKGESTEVQLSIEAKIPSIMEGMVKGKVTGMLERVSSKLEGLDIKSILG